MSHETVARRYARAVFEIGKEERSLQDLSKSMAAFADMFTESDLLRQVLMDPLVPEAARENILSDVGDKIGAARSALSAVRLLVKNRRLSALPEIARQLAQMVDEDTRMVRATVTSAAPLAAAYVSRLRAELEKATGGQVVLTTKEDPSLISGVVVQIGDRVIDGSVRAKLQGFRDTLLQQGSRGG